MAWGISPRSTVQIPLGDYNADHYLTLLYHAFENLGWHIGYFDRDGIIGYTNISWQSYAEEVSVRLVNNNLLIKSECVGYQMLFTDYEKNEKNIELLLSEIEYVEYHLQNNLQETTQQLMDTVPENQFINLANPPMGAKEKLLKFWSAFTPREGYWITPLLVIINSAIFIITRVVIIILFIINGYGRSGNLPDPERIFLSLGYSGRSEVLNGEVWRLITNTFLHFSFMHLLGNMVVLIYIGSLIEGKLGKWNYLLLYLFTGICASMTSVVWHDKGVMGGASGAIFGLFGILLALLSTDFYEKNARKALLISTAIFVAYNIIPLGRHIDHAAHFGGLIAGYILGLAAYWGLKHKKQRVIAVISLAITVVFTAVCISFTPRYDLKQFELLNLQTSTIIEGVNSDLYGPENSDLPHQQRLDRLEKDLLPKIAQLNTISKKLKKLTLPEKKRQVANIKAKILLQQCAIFHLLYKEVRDQDSKKYRAAIIKATDNIHQLQLDWGKIHENE